jgi:hypothetical protein
MYVYIKYVYIYKICIYIYINVYKNINKCTYIHTSIHKMKHPSLYRITYSQSLYVYDDDDDVYLNKLQTKGVKKSIYIQICIKI